MFVYAIRSPYTKESYFRRLRRFFDAIDLCKGMRMEERAILSLIEQELTTIGPLVIYLILTITERKCRKKGDHRGYFAQLCQNNQDVW